MEKISVLTEREIKEINRLMERKSEIILEPRKDGYFIYESRKKLIMRPENKTESRRTKRAVRNSE